MTISRPEVPGLFSQETDFASYLNSSQKLSKLEINRLEMKWKKICENEKKSKERNRKLLEDFERVERHAEVLAAKSERLKSYKQQYENYISKMYPRWKEELENSRSRKQQARNSTSNGPGARAAPLRHAGVPSDMNQSDRSPIPNPVLSSTLAQPSQSALHHNGSLYNRSLQDEFYLSDSQQIYPQTTHGEFSSDDRQHPDSWRLQHTGNMQPSRFAQPPRIGWQTSTGFAGPQGNLDDRLQRTIPRPYPGVAADPYQGSFSGIDANGYQRYPDRYPLHPHSYMTSSDPYLNRHQGIKEHSPQGVSHGDSGVHPGATQGARLSAPYEPRTVLQRSWLGQGHTSSANGINGQVEGDFEERHGNQRRYSGPGPMEMLDQHHRIQEEPVSFKRDAASLVQESDSLTRAAMQSGHASITQPQANLQSRSPYVAPEKPLEREAEPSTSPLQIKTSLERNNVYGDRNQIEMSSSSAEQSSEGPSKPVSRRPEEAGGDNSVSSSREAEQPIPPRQLPTEQEKPPERSDERSQGMQGSVSEPAKKEEPEIEVRDTPEVPNEAEEPGLDDEENEDELGFSDLDLPDEGGASRPVTLQQDANSPSVKQQTEKDLERDAAEGEGIVVGNSDAARNVTKEISEHIPESQELERTLSDMEPPVKDQPPTAESTRAESPDDDDDDERMEVKVNEQFAGRIDGTESGLPQETKDGKRPMSLDGFLSLVYAVDTDVEVTFSPETLYRSPMCSPDTRDEILKSAEAGTSLQSFDPNTISMIVLMELPVLVNSFPPGCLFPDRLFAEGVVVNSEKNLRPHLEPSMLKLWKPLFSHLVNVVLNNVMNAEDTGNLFGPLLLSPGSKHQNQSQILLRTILEYEVSDHNIHTASPPVSPEYNDVNIAPRLQDEASAKDDDNLSVASESSNSTLGSTPPKNKAMQASPEENRKTIPDPTVSYEDDFEDEEVPLTETAAYRKMMSSVHSEPDEDDISDLLVESGPSKPQNEASEDVEKELARAISPPVTSPRVKSPVQGKGGKQRPKLSLFDTGGENMADVLGESWSASSLQSTKSDTSDSMTSPPLSPGSGRGYVPSALQKNEPDTTETKKTDGEENEKTEPKSLNESKPKRKTDFWNNSDTESEVDLQLSTGGLDEDDDDFDFYG